MAAILTAPPGRCARCASPVPETATYCPQCGWTRSGHVVTPGARHTPEPARGPLSRRFGAWIVDAAIRSALAGGAIAVALRVGTAADPLARIVVALGAGSALLLIAGLVLVILRGRAGSPGMRAFGLRLVRAPDTRAAGFGRALGRDLLYVLTCVIVIGPFTPLFRADRRGWHDLASGTWIVDRGSIRAPEPAAEVERSPRQDRTPPPPIVSRDPARPRAVPTGPSDAAASLLVVAGGPVVTVRRSALIGREPTAPADHPVEQLVALRNGDRSISKTHALIEIDDGVVYVTDLWSTNGSAVQSDAGTLALAPGVRTKVPVDARLAFGDQRVDLRPAVVPRG